MQTCFCPFIKVDMRVRLISCLFLSLSYITSAYHHSLTHITLSTHTHTHARTQCMSLWHKENSEHPGDRQCMKSLSSKWLMYSAQSPSGFALYWQSRMVKALVKVWDRTGWHGSHTTWAAYQMLQQHIAKGLFSLKRWPWCLCVWGQIRAFKSEWGYFEGFEPFLK